jgi:hypothetical protein
MYTRNIDKKKNQYSLHLTFFSRHVKFLSLLYGVLSFIYLNNPQLAYDWSHDLNYLQYKQYASSK